MTTRPLLLAVATFSAVSVGCTEPTGPVASHVSVLAEDPVWDIRSGASLWYASVSFTLTIRNDGPGPIFYSEGGLSLQRHADGEWRMVWRSIEPAITVPRIEIPPGASLSRSRSAGGSIHGSPATDWSEPIEGYYRIVVLVGDGEGAAPIEDRASQPFELKLQ